MIKKEWSTFLKNRWLIIVAICLSLQFQVFIRGFFLVRYGTLTAIQVIFPVAVVNEDQKVTYNQTVLDVGKELASNLEKNDSMNFSLVSATKANQGLKNGDYYMIITIPSDFSKMRRHY